MTKESKYISVEDAVKTAWMILGGLGYAFNENPQLKETVQSVFDTAPAADVRPVKPGRWIWHETPLYDGKTGYAIQCSICKEVFTETNVREKPKEYNYCPNCGAEMEAGE